MIKREEDFRNEKLNYKIRVAQLEKVPYMVIIGDKEEEKGVISYRTRKGEVVNFISLEEFIKKLKEEKQFIAIKGIKKIIKKGKLNDLKEFLKGVIAGKVPASCS